MRSTRRTRWGYQEEGRFLLPLALLAVVAALGALSDGAAAAKRKSPKQKSPKQSRQVEQDVLRYLPDGCEVLGWIDVAALRRSEAARKLAAADDDSGWWKLWCAEFAAYGLEPEQIDRITVGGSSPATGDELQYLTVVRFEQPVAIPQEDATGARPQWTAEKIGRRTVWVTDGEEPAAVCIPEDRTVVFGEPESLLAVLRRDGPAKLPEKLDRARRLLDPSAGMAFTIVPSAVNPGAELFAVGLPDDLTKRIDAINIEFDLDADLHARVTAVCRDEAAAQQLKEIAAGLWTLLRMQTLEDQEPEVRELIRSVRFAVKGTALTASVKVPGGLLEETEEEDGALGAVATFVPGPFTAEPAVTPSGDTVVVPAAPAYVATTTPDAPAPGYPTTPYPSTYGVPYSATPYGATPCPAPPSTVPPASSYCPPATTAVPAYMPASGGASTYWSGPTYGVPSPRPLQPGPAVELPTLELAEVIRLVEAGVYDDVIGRHLQRHRLAAPLSTDDLILLTKSGASRELILMLQTMPAAPPREHDAGRGAQDAAKTAAEMRLEEPNLLRQPRVPAEFDRLRGKRVVVPSSIEIPMGDAGGEPLAAAPSRVAKKVQVIFLGPEGAKVRWDVRRAGAFDSEPLVCPGRHDFPQGAIYALKWEAISGRPGLTLYPTLEIAPPSEKSAEFLAHNAIPVGLTDEDIAQLVAGTGVTKVVYLPHPEFQELALRGVETLVSSQLEPGADPILEADRRGTILAILRADGKFIAPAHKQRREPVEPAEPGRILIPGAPAPGVPMGLPPGPAPNAESRDEPRPARELIFEPEELRRAIDELIFEPEELRRAIDEWERVWFLDRSDHRARHRTHGGLL